MRFISTRICRLRNRLPNFKSGTAMTLQKLLRFNQAKIYVDGILSQATGALYQPYEASLDLPKDLQRGFLYFEEETLFDYVSALERFRIPGFIFMPRVIAVSDWALDAVAYAEKRKWGQGASNIG